MSLVPEQKQELGEQSKREPSRRSDLSEQTIMRPPIDLAGLSMQTICIPVDLAATGVDPGPWVVEIRNHPKTENLKVGTRYAVKLSLSLPLEEAPASDLNLELIVVSDRAKLEGAQMQNSEADGHWMTVLSSQVSTDGTSPGAEFSMTPVAPGECKCRVFIFSVDLRQHGRRMQTILDLSTQVLAD